ncbi:hypothetical protein [Alkalicoccobacillus porphyridii]|nr:hypothetical protein [Alkalicoccobacillus porphyridii]
MDTDRWLLLHARLSPDHSFYSEHTLGHMAHRFINGQDQCIDGTI